MPGELDGHVALVTGGNRGIGLGMAEGLARAGATVAIWGTNPDANAAARDRLEQLGAAVHAERCDVSDEAAVVESFARTVAAVGTPDSVFANAGIAGPRTRFTELSLAEWHRVLSVNLDGTFLTLREGARHLVERGTGGSLIAVSSTSAVHGAPRQQPYATSKGALLSLTRSLAVELARHRIRVNALVPGWTDTDLLAAGKSSERFVEATVTRTPAGRWADPTEFGSVATFLADPRLTFHTGATLVVDGGYTVY